MSWNKKEQETLIELKKHKIDICGISETKRKGKGSVEYEDFVFLYSGKDKNERAQSGVGVLINKKFENSIWNVQYINDRLIMVTLSYNTCNLHMISAYAPDINKPIEEITEFYDKLQELMDTIPESDKLVIMGDFNARIGDEILNGVKNRFNESVINENGEKLIEFCSQNLLRLNNTFFPHKPQHKYTWSNTRGHQSTIDYIITNRSILPSQILDVRTLTSANVGSDHGLVLCKIRENIPRSKQRKPEYIEKLNAESLNTDSTKLLYENRLRDKILNSPITEESSVEDAWEKLSSNIIAAAREALGTRKVNIHANNIRTPWFTTEIKILCAEKRKAYLKYMSCKSAETYREYRVVRNRTNQRVKEIKEEHWASFSADMEHDLYGAQKKVWSMLRKQKKPISELFQITNITEEAWISHFTQLYNSTSMNNPEVLVMENAETDFTIDESVVALNIKKLKNRKAPGLDEITNELLKYGGSELSSEISKLFNIILKHELVPIGWKNSITMPIFKKGDKADPQNYRGICLLSALVKLFTKILSQNITETAGISEEQQGFRTNRSTVDAIFILSQILEKAIEYNHPAFMCFIDLAKAFDKIRLSDV
ncbi:uncharacterized protein LOC129618936 [Condylostylus longicornis]|uniref:uncharacterized protein LOC129618936 n=1 Tax=Condylostylus longicornis TaxID=2530218 RepID=UPI00244DB378|nr:uncharacterized protein LOC129618936 [Condylostylus longicornis]